ncbi:hypothetical protein J3R30DRAFT_3718764 [Lentinula aciculospora]|uniref:Secreted protein n=1 Tax=Lentinula aciculospora TaxID=153920 RepID=A0A9W8ZTR7_9AGAR|nr:hypothetical protein J3R30DRAFT_3718764 [Lentinula aciculospora]
MYLCFARLVATCLLSATALSVLSQPLPSSSGLKLYIQRSNERGIIRCIIFPDINDQGLILSPPMTPDETFTLFFEGHPGYRLEMRSGTLTPIPATEAEFPVDTTHLCTLEATVYNVPENFFERWRSLNFLEDRGRKRFRFFVTNARYIGGILRDINKRIPGCMRFMPPRWIWLMKELQSVEPMMR